jgi:hypothetical protein
MLSGKQDCCSHSGNVHSISPHQVSLNLSSDLALYGTALVAARFQQVKSGAIPAPALPLKNVSVHLCGAFASCKSDLQLLLLESGATTGASESGRTLECAMQEVVVGMLQESSR